jgi:hypothetical protein
MMQAISDSDPFWVGPDRPRENILGGADQNKGGRCRPIAKVRARPTIVLQLKASAWRPASDARNERTHEMNVPGAMSLLHSFSQDEIERRQYRRVDLQFPLWWLKDFKGNAAVAGIGIEISGGGLQFLLEHKIEQQCSLAFVRWHLSFRVSACEPTFSSYSRRPARTRAKIGIATAQNSSA